MKAILQLIGPPGTGKTTLSELLVDELSGQGLLVLDAAADHGLTRQFNPEDTGQTLAEEVQTLLQKPSQPNEAIDWAFRDLVIPIGEENDLITVGALPAQVAPGIEKMIAYGLKRLLAEYDVAVVDGYQPLLARLLPREMLRTIVVVTPDRWEGAFLPTEEEDRTPALITNRYEATAVSTAFQGFIDEALDAGRVQLIGKLPNCPTSEGLHQQLPEAFHNALLRLDLPFNTSSAQH